MRGIKTFSPVIVVIGNVMQEMRKPDENSTLSQSGEGGFRGMRRENFPVKFLCLRMRRENYPVKYSSEYRMAIA